MQERTGYATATILLIHYQLHHKRRASSGCVAHAKHRFRNKNILITAERNLIVISCIRPAIVIR